MCDMNDDFFGCHTDDNDIALNDKINDTSAHNDVVIDHQQKQHQQYGELSTRESAAMGRQYYSIGYHETYDSSHEGSLQNGFDIGYKNNYDTALHLGNLLGQYALNVEISKRRETTTTTTTSQQQSEQNNLLDSQSPQIESERRLREAAHRIRNVLLTITQKDDSRDKSNTQINSIASDSTAIDMVQEQEEQHRHQQECLRGLTDDVEKILGFESKSVEE